MRALDQYSDLYRRYKDVIDQNGAEALNKWRDIAAEKLGAMQLPARGDENFENIDLEALLSPDYGINLQRLPLEINPESTFRCDVPVSSRSVLMMVNDTFMSDSDALLSLPTGVEAGSLNDFARYSPELVSQYYGSLADVNNPITALNTLFAQDGLFLRIKKGVKVEKPIQLVNILSGGMPLMAVRRLLVIVEDEAEAKLLVCDHSQRDDVKLMSLETVEVFVGKNARFDYYNIEESTESTTRLSTFYLRQEEHSQANIDGITLFNGTTRNEYYCRFGGEHAGLRLYGMGIEDKQRTVSTYSVIRHDVPRCQSDELFKYSVNDRASGSFTGKIYVAEGAVKTEAYQSNRNLLGSTEARMYSKPQLEIYNDDVKCSHGCAIGQLDPMQIFYMRTRGLTEDEAKLLLRQAFMSDVIAAIDVDWLRDRLKLLTERRFAGLESACATCGAGCV